MAKRMEIMALLAKGAQPSEKYLAELKPPSTWSPPDDAGDGREFEGMFSGKMKPDGTLCITKIGGIGGEEPQEEMVEESGDADAMRGMDLNNNQSSGGGNY